MTSTRAGGGGKGATTLTVGGLTRTLGGVTTQAVKTKAVIGINTSEADLLVVIF